MTEMDNRWQAQAAGITGLGSDPALEERSQVSRALAGALVVSLLLIPAAFVSGWRLGRIVGALRGF